MSTVPFHVDGFVILRTSNGEPVELTACTEDEPFRENVEHQVMLRVRRGYCFFDTRWHR